MAKLNRLLFTALLIGLPPAGVWLTGGDIAPYFEFPPRTRFVEHAPFSRPVFIGLAIAILATVVPFLVRTLRTRRATTRIAPTDPFPGWGWLGLGLGIVFWILAWTRLDWMEPLQLYTFTPQWLAYIVVINALTCRRTGRCLLTHETRYLLQLFPLSALFWWFFEYLNRFVQNWYYVGCDHFSPLQYFSMATLAFSTVLPAVLSTEEWLAANPRSSAGLQFNRKRSAHHPRAAGTGALLSASAGLLFIGRYPDVLYPLLWVAPLLLLMGFQWLEGRPCFPETGNGDWRRVYRFALAALICGFFWELWNGHSLAKWIYSVPFVHRFQLFEMPILGYAGYLPFGLECAVIADLIPRRRVT